MFRANDLRTLDHKYKAHTVWATLATRSILMILRKFKGQRPTIAHS